MINKALRRKNLIKKFVKVPAGSPQYFRILRDLKNLEDYREQCVICQNEGPHDIDDRPHVMEGQE